jgi:hypothetical protein
VCDKFHERQRFQQTEPSLNTRIDRKSSLGHDEYLVGNYNSFFIFMMSLAYLSTCSLYYGMQPAAVPYFKRKDITRAICGPCCGLFQVFANHFHRFIGSYFSFLSYRFTIKMEVMTKSE